MRLIVVVSDCPPVGEGDVDGPAAPALSLLLARARRLPLHSGWRGELAADLLALPDAGAGAISAAAIPAAAGLDAWCATPVHLQAASDHLRLPADGIVVLSDAECVALAQSFAESFGDSGLRLHPAMGRFVLTGLPPGEGLGDPADQLGTRLTGRSGGDAAWRRLASEVELWLHEHAVNRGTRGRRPVNALWLWGGGRAVANLAPRREAAGWQLHGDDPFIAGLAALVGGRGEPLSGRLDDILDRSAARDVLLQLSLARMPATAGSFAAIDEHWLAPALRRLRDGALQSVDVLIGPVRARVTRPRLACFWRRRRAWWEHLRR